MTNLTPAKVNAILKQNGLQIAKRTGGQGWWTTEKAGFSSMKAGDAIQVNYYRTSSENVINHLRKAAKVLAAAGLNAEISENSRIYVK